MIGSMRQCDIPNLHPSKADDFYKELRRIGRSVLELVATPQNLADSPGRCRPLMATVTIRNIDKGAERARIKPGTPRHGFFPASKTMPTLAKILRDLRTAGGYVLSRPIPHQ
jgi:hypothetical protein